MHRAVIPLLVSALVSVCSLATPVGAATAQPRGPAYAWVVGAGASLATPSGHPLFPTLAGRPLGGWLDAFGGQAMAATWGGYHQRHPLGPGLDVAVTRAAGLLAAYLVRKDGSGAETCAGHVIHEPRALAGADTAERQLRMAGFGVRRSFLATRGATFATDAGVCERRAGGYVERYVFVRLPGRGAEPPRIHLAEAAFYPAALEAGLSSWTTEGREALAAFLANLATREPANTPPP